MNAEFVKALLKLKAEIAPVTKSQQGYGYKYADLAEVHRAIDEPLHKNGFILYHEFSFANGQTFMDTHLIHEHGALASTLPLDIHELAKMNFYQAMGSAITYLRRYAIMAMLGIPAEEDDGKSAADPKRQNGNGQKVTPRNTGPDAVRSWADGFIKALKDCRDRREAQAGVDKVSKERWEALEKNNPAIYAEVMNAVEYSMENLPDEAPAPSIAAE